MKEPALQQHRSRDVPSNSCGENELLRVERYTAGARGFGRNCRFAPHPKVISMTAHQECKGC